MEISITIIDDDSDCAKAVKEEIKGFKSNYRVPVSYKIEHVFEGIHAFKDAAAYLTTGGTPDIIFSDYDLKKGKGIDIFKIVGRNKWTYKVMHSITHRIPDEISLEESRKYIDDVCKWKKKDHVHDVLSRFENDVLDIKLFGNPAFRDNYLVNASRWKDSKIMGLDCYRILHAKSHDDGTEEATIFFVDEDGKIDSRKRADCPLVSTFEYDKFFFRKVNRSQIVNMLWIAKIDLMNKTIRFITPGKEIYQIDFKAGVTFDREIKPYQDQINSLTEFFTF